MDKSPDMHPRAWAEQGILTLEEATAGYMVDVTATSHCLKQ